LNHRMTGVTTTLKVRNNYWNKIFETQYIPKLYLQILIILCTILIYIEEYISIML